MSKSMLRQGDVLVMPINKLPDGLAPIEPDAGRLILARGEATNHHHSIAMADRVALFREDGSGGGLFLFNGGTTPALLEHQEHSALSVPPGAYEVRIQRTMASGLVRQVVD